MVKKSILFLLGFIIIFLVVFGVVKKYHIFSRFVSLRGSSLSELSFEDALKQGFQKKIQREVLLATTSDKITLERKEEYVAVVDYEQRVIRAIEKSSPAVVSVIISKDVPVLEQYYATPLNNDPLFQDFFGGQVQIPQVRQGGVERKEVGGGSGFIISSDGLIVTNKHVVSDPNASYIILLNDGKRFPAKVLAKDAQQDMAVLKIEASGLPTLSLGDSDTVRIGQTAIAIGNSLGEFRNTASTGIISGLARTITAGGGGIVETLQGVIQTDAAINQGNSGGPLLNLRGEVIGVNAAIAQGAQSVGFAIPINKVKRAIEDVKATGKISAPYLGIRYVILDEIVQKKEGLGVSYGAFVRSGEKGGVAIVPNSPAKKAGIKERDIILEVNGKKVTKDVPLTDIVSQYKVGDTLTLKVLRGSETIEVKITLEQRPTNL
ncbi:MAG: trypsin-like peptidase domain-containing protein [Parcubacteria group bacterium]|nr:trypsin-like peptidase domain-containing protein [Parcubacteria group bacterium]